MTRRVTLRRRGQRAVVYALVTVIALWLVGPFAWLLITSVSYQRNLLARPLAFVPPEVTLDNYLMVLGMIRFHAEGQAAKILPSMLNSLIVAAAVTLVNLIIGTTTLPPVIAGMNGQINIDYSVIAASGFLAALPAVLLVLGFQKYMVQGLTAGSVKG